VESRKWNFMNFQTLWTLWTLQTLWTFKLSTHHPPSSILCDYLRGFISAISARTISFSLINADLKTQIYADFFLRLSARVFSATICESYFFSLIYADLKTQIYADFLCDYLRGFFLRYLRELFFLADLRGFKNADLRWFSLRLSARVFSANICENYSFSLINADLKTQIYADYQLITNNLLLTTDNWNSITHPLSPIPHHPFPITHHPSPMLLSNFMNYMNYINFMNFQTFYSPFPILYPPI